MINKNIAFHCTAFLIVLQLSKYCSSIELNDQLTTFCNDNISLNYDKVFIKNVSLYLLVH